ncbi:MAG: thiamine pyrophosphate-binding protein, partial [Trebonia sp.]
MTGGEALVAALEAHGAGLVFGIPGTHNLPIYAALARSGIRHVSPRHEQGAGFAADGWARASGRPGVCITTTGPAVLNAATAAAQAYSDSVPVLLISPGLPLRHPGHGNGYLHEVKDQHAALGAV